MSEQSLAFEQFIKASPAQIYYAFTNATALREWLCNIATVKPQIGGRFYLGWNSGFYTCGEYLALETDREVSFSWFGRNDPHPTRVHVTIDPQDGGAHVRLTHSGLGEGEEWARTLQAVQDGWNSGLENLASVLETGQDLRFTLRPMMGITVGEFGPEIAARLGIVVSHGVRLDGVVEGMGAKAAGLQQNDVIVSLNGIEIKEFTDLNNFLQGQRAGNRIAVVFYRGAEKKTTEMELTRRSLPDIPDSLDGLAEIVREHYQRLAEEITALLEGVSDEEASYKPEPSEWSIKEVIAHLLHGERYWQIHTTEIVMGQESWADDYVGNLEAAVQATASAYPTLGDMLDELKRIYSENIALYERLPAEFSERKGSFWRLAYESLETPYHYYSHYDQIRANIAAARAR